ncbi:AMP-binding protein [Pseudoalteromonas xiamenensis]|uniref:AMP-binding protein n=1 Tax=Pseudoalteromonas xiamenensis TaxID=882626 RepID=UPI0035E5CB7B
MEVKNDTICESLSYSSGPTDTPLNYQTIGDYLESIVDTSPESEAIVVSHQNVRLSYRDYLKKINQVAASLVSLGVKPGDRVGIWSPNNIEWSLIQFATAKIGAIMVCINPAYRPDELEFAINNVSCSVLVMANRFKNSNYVEMLESLAPELRRHGFGQLNAEKLPSLKHVITIEQTPLDCMMSFDEFLTLASDLDHLKAREFASTLTCLDPINIQFTSGTTGRPKGATLSHFNILNNARLVADAMNLSSSDRLCIPVPLYHCFGMVLGNLVCMSVGASAVFPHDSFDPEITLQVVESEKCTGLHGVPTMFIAELELPNFESFNLSTLRTGIMAGATCPEKVMRLVQDKMHMKEVLIGYGQTECSPINHITSIDSPLEKRVNTVGRTMPHTHVKIIDESGNVVPRGKPGELLAKGYCVMSEYWEDPDKTAATIDTQGWLHSGDLAVMDNEGYVQIVGRIKDLIIRGGENIYPREIEETLYHLEQIQDAAVFAVKDERYGEAVCAWLQLKPGYYISEEDVRAYLKDKLAYFKIPKFIRFVDAYPMTVTGKLQKFKMRHIMENELSSEPTE